MKHFSAKLKHLIETCYADRVEKVWLEHRSYEINLKTGWTNAFADPIAPLHTIHDNYAKACIVQLQKATLCDCEYCERREAA